MDRQERIRAAAIRWGVLVTGLLLLLVGIGYALPGWSVARGAGTPGVFTVVRQADECPRCVLRGTFTPDDPAEPALDDTEARGRLPVALKGERTRGVGHEGAVYPPGGGGAWRTGTLVAGGGAVVLLGWLWTARAHRRRRRRHETAPAS
ncbi:MULTISPECIES: hypothetical protein [unclassified Streptomyces]|uniref:hypothetical protein n=1 Tax=unclassified Streptomyces TaxID=2593676 RepID=UPI00166022C6|nr:MULTISPECIES: hypothetical protein [unclassified Streptomyces]MBD0710902.1 hypothetical protein [Streptomyces sp. CBMA291]MBD0717321.1 hypothetical protein [Streptomyces sp. CBMA370]